MSRIFSDMNLQQQHDFTPSRYLDVGCGSGSSTLYSSNPFFINNRSCLETFPSIRDCSLVDGSEYMLQFTHDLISEKAKIQSPIDINSYSSLPSLLEKVCE